MRFTRRKRRRILETVLPLLAIVWATFPWLPCCQINAADASAKHESAVVAVITTEAITIDDSAHCPDSGSEASTAVCTDAIQNGNESRPASQSSPHVALVAFVYLVPVVLSVEGTLQPIREPPRPLPRRSLHLEKSVLLI